MRKAIPGRCAGDCGAGVARSRGRGEEGDPDLWARRGSEGERRPRAGAGWGQARGWAGGACALRWLASGAGGEGGEACLRGVREDRAQVGSRAAR